MLTQDSMVLFLLLIACITGIGGYALGRADKEDYRDDKKRKKLKLIEGIDGVSSVQISPLRYVELLTKEEECNELKLAIKRFADETPKGN